MASSAVTVYLKKVEKKKKERKEEGTPL